MAKVENPKIKNMNSTQKLELPLRGDETSAKKYLEEKDLGTFTSYETTDPRFSNDYGLSYNYYVSGQTYETYWGNTGITYEWKTEFGYYPIISSITYS